MDSHYTCRECGCTEARPCTQELDGRLEGCSWVEPDLCSACVPGAAPGWEHPKAKPFKPGNEPAHILTRSELTNRLVVGKLYEYGTEHRDGLEWKCFRKIEGIDWEPYPNPGDADQLRIENVQLRQDLENARSDLADSDAELKEAEGRVEAMQDVINGQERRVGDSYARQRKLEQHARTLVEALNGSDGMRPAWWLGAADSVRALEDLTLPAGRSPAPGEWGQTWTSADINDLGEGGEG